MRQYSSARYSESSLALALRLRERRRLVPLGAVAALGIAALAGTGLMKPAGDRGLTVVESHARAALFIAAGSMALPAVLPPERQMAVSSMRLSAADQAALERQNPELVWLTLWDDRDEDGDTVAVLSSGFQQVVRLAHAPVRIAIPRPLGSSISIQGVWDGGGGITVALATDRRQVALPVLAVGQTLAVPVW